MENDFVTRGEVAVDERFGEDLNGRLRVQVPFEVAAESAGLVENDPASQFHRAFDEGAGGGGGFFGAE